MLPIMIVLCILQLAAGIRLIQVAQRDRLYNLFWLAAAFCISAIMYFLGFVVVGQLLNQGGWNVLISISGETASAICILFFTHAAFYQGRSSPRWIYMALTILAAAGVVWFDVQNRMSGVDEARSAVLLADMTVMVGIAKFFPWGWHLYAGWKSYATILSSEHVENWIKARYKLVIGYSIAMVIGSIFLLATPLLSFQVSNGLTGITWIIAVVLQFLAWGMPEPYRQWLNRAPQAAPKPQPEMPPQPMIRIISAAMTENSQLTPMVCAYSIRKVVGKMTNTDDSNAINQYLRTMEYQQWEKALQDPLLSEFIANSGVANANQIVQKGRDALVKNQSLLSMSAKV